MTASEVVDPEHAEVRDGEACPLDIHAARAFGRRARAARVLSSLPRGWRAISIYGRLFNYRGKQPPSMAKAPATSDGFSLRMRSPAQPRWLRDCFATPMHKALDNKSLTRKLHINGLRVVLFSSPREFQQCVEFDIPAQVENAGIDLFGFSVRRAAMVLRIPVERDFFKFPALVHFDDSIGTRGQSQGQLWRPEALRRFCASADFCLGLSEAEAASTSA